MGSKSLKKSSSSKKDAGKNIRVSTDGWNKIRTHCIKEGIVMGVFVENCALSKIPFKKQKL